MFILKTNFWITTTLSELIYNQLNTQYPLDTPGIHRLFAYLSFYFDSIMLTAPTNVIIAYFYMLFISEMSFLYLKIEIQFNLIIWMKAICDYWNSLNQLICLIRKIEKDYISLIEMLNKIKLMISLLIAWISLNSHF